MSAFSFKQNHDMQYDFLLTCEDGKKISATHFGYDGSPLVIVSSAVGTDRGYYSKFANYLVEQNFQVVTFDYRGIGESKAKKDDKSTCLSNWGVQDLTAVINWAKTKAQAESILLVGHSIAGQIFPLAKNKELVNAAYFVASQTASSSYWSGTQKLSVKLFWNLMLPTTTTLTGSLPAWTYGGKQPLPKYIAKEWAQWGRHKNGSLQDCQVRAKQFKEINIPLRFISISDDKMLAPKPAVERLVDQYGGSRKEHQHWYPDEFGKKSIGHFGFFRSVNSELWEDVGLWLDRHI